MIPILDNGHGNNTAGKRSPKWSDGKQLFEWKTNRKIVRKIARNLDAKGVKYKILVPDDYDVSLAERCRRANAIPNGYVVSVHCNAGGGTGFEVWTSKGKTKSDAMATIFFEEAQKELKEFKMRADYTDGDPDKESQFYILKNTRCPAVLVESLFMDNERDCRFLMSEQGLERIARMYTNAIIRINEQYP